MSMTSLDTMKTKVSTMLKGIERYNPENIQASTHSTLKIYKNEQNGVE